MSNRVMLRGRARPSANPFLYVVVELHTKLYSFSKWRFERINNLGYNDPAKAAEDLGYGIVKRIVSDSQEFDVDIEYKLGHGEFTGYHILCAVIFICFCLMIATVQIFWWKGWLPFKLP